MILESDSRNETVDLNALRQAREASHHHQDTNVGALERAVSALAGGALAWYGLKQRSWGGALLALAGGAMLKRGVSGHCEMYSMLGVRSADADITSSPMSRFVDVEKQFTIQRPVEEVYNFWRHFENLTCVMPHLCCVGSSEAISHWEAQMPNGIYQWDAELIAEEPNRLIAWRTLEGSDFEHVGVVEFTPAPGDRGTEIRLYMRYRPPMGVVGIAASKFMRSGPANDIREGIRRTKQLLESGEVATGCWNREQVMPEVPAELNVEPEAVPAYGEAGDVMGMEAKSISDRAHETEENRVGEASEESFPASDAPSWTPTSHS